MITKTSFALSIIFFLLLVRIAYKLYYYDKQSRNYRKPIKQAMASYHPQTKK